ncbi:MAG: transglycosylase SLT domain-containing protein [Bacteroidales bacterium]
MFKRKIISLLILSTFISFSAKPINPENDTLHYGVEYYSNFEDNLDSLLNLWYVKNSIKTNYTIQYNEYADIPEFSDSVYMERLKNIPSVVELNYNSIVRNYIHVYTKKRRENVQSMIGLSDYYFPMIEEIFEGYGLPTELKYMAVIESALNPRAVSRAGATGMWQFMYGTARMYNLTINSFVDERRDPVKATHAAAKFLQDLYGMFGDWTLVIAAYNCGPGNVNKAIRRTGGKRDFWQLYYHLPRETRGYVPAYIAAAYTMNYYQEHYISPVIPQISLATDTIMINDNVHLRQISEVLNIPLQQLRDLNPQYKIDIIPAKGSAYPVTVPLDFAGKFITYQDSIFSYKDSIFFTADNSIKNPQKSYYIPQAPTGREKLVYTVKLGDNLGFIAEWYNVGLSDLRYWNNIHGNRIRAGQNLFVYVHKNNASKYSDINSLSFEEKQRRIGKSVTPPDEIVEQPSYTGNYVYYTVKSGDTLWEIAKRYSGISETDIMKLNNMTSGRSLKAGQIIKIKPKS